MEKRVDPIGDTLSIELDEDGNTGAKFLLQTCNFNIFTRAVTALAKIGEMLYVEPVEQGLMVRSFNRTGTAYAVFLFNVHFFAEVNVSWLDMAKDNTCRLAMKSALSTLKSAHFSDRNFLSCKLCIDPEKDFLRMETQMVCEVCRLFQIPYLEKKSVKKGAVDKQKLANLAVCSAENLLPLIDQVQSKIDELVIHAHPEKLIIKNFMFQATEKRRAIKSEATMLKDQFTKLRIKRETEIAFSAKEFKAIILFASEHSANVSLYFDQPSKPIIIAVEGDLTYTSEFHLSTVEIDCASYEQSTSGRESTHSTQVDNAQIDRENEMLGNRNCRASLGRETDRPQSSNRSTEVPLEAKDVGLLPENNALASKNVDERKDVEMLEDNKIVQSDDGPMGVQLENMDFDLGEDYHIVNDDQNLPPTPPPNRTQDVQPNDVMEDQETLPASPGPQATKRDRVFRKFFMSHGSSTQHASQAGATQSFMVDETRY